MAPPQFGAWLDERGAHFRIWSPSAARVELLIDAPAGRHPERMTPAGGGMFALDLEGPSHGTRYRYRIDGKDPIPDPASGWQPDGVHGPSAIDDPREFAWTSKPVPIDRHDLVVYELHVGTFTPEGTFDSARERIGYLRDLGISAIELMPVAEFAGSRNWGYDGVALFAPSSRYGGPAAFRRFVDAAHGAGLSVILDVVYNHLGPDGNYLIGAAPEFFTKDAASPWGDAVNIGDPTVRAWLIANAIHWASSFQVDGFRLDATHALPHEHAPLFLRELVEQTREAAGRDLIFIAEDHRNLSEMLRPPHAGGWGLDGVWADDFHHQVRVATAGDRHGYYRDFTGDAAHLARTISLGWFFCGEHSAHEGAPRGTDPSGLEAGQFVWCIQNHDQVGNRAFGDRLHHAVPLDVWRAVSALLLLGPGTPLIFMGQEWAASSPFHYFTDHHDELGRLVTEGRRNEFRHFPEFRDSAAAVPDPQAESTFERSRLDWHEAHRPPHDGVLALYRALIKLRRSERVLQSQEREVRAIDSDTLAIRTPSHALAVRLRGEGRVTFEHGWEPLLTTEDAAFGGAQPPSLRGDTIDFRHPSALILRRA